jgi:chromosomal replication initiation ATPase DnaA
VQLIFDFPNQLDFCWQGFVGGNANQEALSWLKNWPHWPAYGLALYGPPCSGKTHLSRLWQKVSGAFLLTPKDQDVSPLSLASTPVLIDEFSDSAWDEDWLFHFLNARTSLQASILIVDRKAPSAWSFKKHDVRSRCLTLSSVGIGMPNETFVEALLIALFQKRGVSLSQDTAKFLSIRLERSYATILHAVKSLNDASLTQGRPITVPFLKEIGDGWIGLSAEEGKSCKRN